MSLVLVSLLLVVLTLFIGLIWSLQQRHSKYNMRVAGRLRALSESTHSVALAPKDVFDRGHRARINAWLIKYRWAKQLQHNLLMSGKDLRLDEFLGLMLATGTLCLIVAILTSLPVLVTLVTTLLAVFTPYAVLGFMIRRRQDQLEQQLPDVLDFISRSMQAGHSFSSSMQMAASESPEPISQEFMTASNQMNFGESVHDALSSLAKRIECADMSYFAVAVIINREIGGDLAALLKNVSELIRTRLQLRMSIHALTGEARASAWILGLIPIILGLILSVMQPKMMSLLITDPLGQKMLAYSILVMGLGILWMRRLIRIRI